MRAYLIVIVCSIFLVGCHRELSQEYLMRHPDVLEKELLYCQSGSGTEKYCEHVKQVMEEFVALAKTQREEPEAFGNQILQMQIEQAALQQQIVVLQRENHLSAADTLKLNELQKTSKEQAKKIQALLAVVAAGSADEL
jgi:hypothetical protein